MPAARAPSSSSLPTPSSLLARESIAQDLQELSDEEQDEAAVQSDNDDDSDLSTIRPAYSTSLGYSMTGSYRRPSIAATRARPTVLPSLAYPETGYLSKQDRDACRDDERSLLRDNQIIPPKHPRRASSRVPQIIRRLSMPILKGGARGDNADAEPGLQNPQQGASETSPLLGDSQLPYGGQDTPENIDKQWHEAVVAGKIRTTWQRETKVLLKYSGPIIFTSLLQYSLPVASMLTVGHLGKVPLGAATLGQMTASITGYAVYQGLATSLDTLCAQAYGSGHKKLVGLQMQRMVYFLWTITIVIATIWLFATNILTAILPDKEIAKMTGLYLKVLVIGAPGYAAFESGKRFVQAQGLFSATFYCLGFCAPLNAFLHWLFVWHFKWGFIGAPIAVVITENLLPVTLFLYVYFVDGRQCWGGFSKAAFKNWGPMIKLALPGLIMVLAEWMAFELLTLSSSWMGTAHLAAQSVLNTIAATMFQVPFAMSIAASTRVANLIGATLEDAAKTSAKVALVIAVVVGLMDMVILSSLRYILPRICTNDDEVIELAAQVMPLVAAFQLFDSFAATCNGILRALGRQEIGGYVGLFAYYCIALPISFSTAFALGWKLLGLWAGAAVGLFTVAVVESLFIYKTSWITAVEQAKARNAVG